MEQCLHFKSVLQRSNGECNEYYIPKVKSSLSKRVEKIFWNAELNKPPCVNDDKWFLDDGCLLNEETVEISLINDCGLPLLMFDADETSLRTYNDVDKMDEIRTYNDACVDKMDGIVSNVLYSAARGAYQRLCVAKNREDLLNAGVFDWCVRDRGFIVRAMELFVSQDPEDGLACVLLVSSLMERGMAAAYTRDAGRKAPPLFRDLVESPWILRRFGRLRELVRSLVIHPWGVNLRNVTWHGFVVGEELPRPWIALLICLCASLAKRAGDHPPEDPAPLKLKHVWTTGLGTVLADEEALLALASNNPMVPAGYERLLCAAWRRLKCSNSSSGLLHMEALSLLVVTIEHGLRRAFCVLNGAEERSATADSAVLYTTLDDLTVSHLDDGRENGLVAFLGEPLMMALMDLFHLPLGPRIRDRVSHGEVLPCDLAPGASGSFIVESVFNLSVAMMAKARNAPLPAFESYQSVCHLKGRARFHVSLLASRWAALQSLMTSLQNLGGGGSDSTEQSTVINDVNGTQITCRMTEDLVDVFRLRVGQHAVPDNVLEFVVGATKRLPIKDWVPFGEGGDAVGPMRMWNSHPQSMMFSKKVAHVAKECHHILAVLHRQMVEIASSGATYTLGKADYRRVDVVPRVLRVTYVIGRILVERMSFMEATLDGAQRVAQSSLPAALLEQNEKFFTTLYSFVLHLRKNVSQEGGSGGAASQLLIPSKVLPIIDRLRTKIWSAQEGPMQKDTAK